MCVGRILLKCEGECWFMSYSLLYRAVVFGAIFKSPKIVFSVQWEEIMNTIPVCLSYGLPLPLSQWRKAWAKIGQVLSRACWASQFPRPWGIESRLETTVASRPLAAVAASSTGCSAHFGDSIFSQDPRVAPHSLREQHQSEKGNLITAGN